MYNQAVILICRAVMANLLGLSLIVIAYYNGWLEKIFISDTTYLCVVIVVAFVTGMVITMHRLIWACREIGRIERRAIQSEWFRFWHLPTNTHGDTRQFAVESLKGRMSARIGIIRHIANALVLLGLIGTVIGFIIALSGVDPETVGDVEQIGKMISLLLEGMSIALYTTLVGSIANVWLMFNFHLLNVALTLLTSLILEEAPESSHV